MKGVILAGGTGSRLHPLTRKALDRMRTHQRPDGGWNGIGGAARTFILDYEETHTRGHDG